ncbi:FAD-binding oxidoreductase [Chitinimonas lacunae]|uniref:FAD-dependent oxidoreductase n=1 Tax=Chitinimonas lacunae TaxID=1963018 RepID=A0ABV8MXB4_9NEIS
MKVYRSWGRLCAPADQVHIPDHRASELPPPRRDWLPVGHGRSYGDVGLNAEGGVIDTARLDRLISFDRTSGVLCCESGVTLAQVLALAVPCGWFLPVTPGTRFASIGGAIANDVHGKNHHSAGSFGCHVHGFELLRSDGRRLWCSPSEHPDWFGATIGGLGLTGLVTWVALQLRPINNPYLWVEARRFANLEAFFALDAQAQRRHEYTVAWLDCLASGKARGRGVYYGGDHAPLLDQLPPYRSRERSVPFTPPISLINGPSLYAFNTLYYRKPLPKGQALVHYEPYFYPLDGLLHWNRIYGPRGFYQYQCVVPPQDARLTLDLLLERIARSGQGSFLAVLKSFGERPSPGWLSFPRPGYTLALDFPQRGESTRALFRELDAVVREAGGALYPAKDACMDGELFRHGYPAWERFSEFIDPAFSSGFWRRVNR